MRIEQATTSDEIAAVRALFEEYAAWSKVDLCFQGFAAELASLPGAYAPPKGRLFLAIATDGLAGCIALRPFKGSACEMKRLYVRPAYRGRGLGRTLAERAVADARRIGYTSIFLDTLPSMETAIRLYESLGFERRAAYYDTPLEDTVFMELRL